MRPPDPLSFRQRPTGLFKVLLRAPAWLYRARLGFLCGERLMLITHIGRRSGRRYQTPVEVVAHDADAGMWVVCSGTGPTADWYQNLQVTPAIAMQVGSRRWVPTQQMLSAEDAAEMFHTYEQAHPATARWLLEAMGNSYNGTDAGRVAMMAAMPMVAFTEPRAASTTQADDMPR